LQEILVCVCALQIANYLRACIMLYRFQDFYEEGERELLLTEVLELRDQVSALF